MTFRRTEFFADGSNSGSGSGNPIPSQSADIDVEATGTTDGVVTWSGGVSVASDAISAEISFQLSDANGDRNLIADHPSCAIPL